MTSLATFFVEMHGLVSGRTTAADVERALGPSASGTGRLGHYTTLVRRQRELLLTTFYPATARALDDWRGGAFLRLCADFTRERPPVDGDPNRFAEPMPDFLERAAPEGRAPEWAAELADLELCHYLTRVGARPADPRDPGVDRTLFVRRYSHDVLHYLGRALGAGDACAPLPAPRAAPITVVVCRPLTGEDPFVFHPSIAGLIALAARAGEPVPDGVDRAELDAAERQLVSWGVISG